MGEFLKKAALFLDRDGVINVDTGHLYLKEDCTFILGIFELVAAAKKLDMYVFVVTNQAGVARGYYSEDDFFVLSKWMNEQFGLHQGRVDEFFYCPHHPDFGNSLYKIDCNCSKPKPGMFEQAKQKYDIDLTHSMMIGDKESDLIASIAAGVKHNLFIGRFKSARGQK